jgi:hypothetical protein
MDAVVFALQTRLTGTWLSPSMQPKSIGTAMPKNRNLTSLRTISEKIAERLNDVGIFQGSCEPGSSLGGG